MRHTDIEAVQAHYDSDPSLEWGRLERECFEFELTRYMMDKYVRPGDTILDIGGGPGRYAIHYAGQGCAVTLAELSGGNVALALEKAAEAGVSIAAHAVNCLDLDRLGLGQFDHVFLMGPLYHLQDPAHQVEAVRAALRRLKPGGKLYASFIQVFAGVIYDLQHGGHIREDMRNDAVSCLLDNWERGEDYIGPAFTEVCFHHPRNIPAFMGQFPLEQLHLFPQEGFLAPNKVELLRREPEEVRAWVELAKRYLEMPELLSWGEHIMYIGQKRGQP